jgi:hypothetical protein
MQFTVEVVNILLMNEPLVSFAANQDTNWKMPAYLSLNPNVPLPPAARVLVRQLRVPRYFGPWIELADERGNGILELLPIGQRFC